MIKTLLAGTVLSTGLFAGGVLGTEDVKNDQKVDKNQVAQETMQSTGGEIKPNPDGSGGEITVPEGGPGGTITINKENGKIDVKPNKEETENKEISTQEGKVKVTVADKDGNITYKEIDMNEIPKDAVPAQPNPGNQKYSETIEMPEGTESKPGYEIGNPEKPEHAETVERPEGTDSKPGIELPTEGK